MAITQHYYSPSTKGIYSAEVHGSTIPTDRVPITLTQYAQVAAGTHSVTVSGTTATTVSITPQAAGADPKVIVDSVGIGNKYGSITIADQETPSAATARFLFGNTTSGYGALRLITNSTKNVTIDAVDWATSATQKHMCLQPNGGNIGIGTATPSAKLYVVGESYVDYANEAGITGGALRFASSSNASSVSNNEYYDGVNRFTRTGGSGKIRIWQTNDAIGGAIDFLSGKTGPANSPITYASTMMLTSDGNVGIGTTTPSAKLNVVGESYVDYESSPGITGGRLRLATNSSYAILSCNEYFDGIANRFSRTGGIGKIRMVHNDANGASAGGMEFLTGGTGNAGATSVGRVTMALTPEGRVGIGTIAPSARLQALNSVGNVARFGVSDHNSLTVGGSSASPYCGIGYNINFDSGNSDKYFAVGGDRTSLIRFHDGGFQFKGNTANGAMTGTPFALTEYMTILKSGRVGIGTTTPEAILEIGGTPVYQTATDWGSSTIHTSVPHLLLRSDTGNTIPEIQFMEKTNKSWVLGGNGTGTGNGANGTFCIRDDFQSGNPVRLAITNTGNVGIGTTTPAVKLEVVGAIRFNSEPDVLAVAGSETSGFRFGSTAFSNYSGFKVKYTKTGSLVQVEGLITNLSASALTVASGTMLLKGLPAPRSSNAITVIGMQQWTTLVPLYVYVDGPNWALYMVAPGGIILGAGNGSVGGYIGVNFSYITT